jgi:hypothetical protein
MSAIESDFYSYAGPVCRSPASGKKTNAMKSSYMHNRVRTNGFPFTTRSWQGLIAGGLWLLLSLPLLGQSTIQFGTTTCNVTEGGGPAVVTVQRANDLDSVVSVDYTTVDGTALAGTDYEAASGSLIIAASEELQEIEVAISNDGASGPDKSFQVRLENASTGALGSPSTTTVTILGSAPVIYQQPSPTSQLVGRGATVRIQVSAKGALMQWQHRVGSGDFVDVPGATSPVLEIKNVTVEQAGEYRFMVSSTTGESVISQIATLTVDPMFTRITEGPIVTTSGLDPMHPAWGDLNNDGYEDLIIGDLGYVDWSAGRPTSRAVPQVYLNNRDGTFRRATEADIGPLATSATAGGTVALVDYDNDGYLDFYQNAWFETCRLWRGGPNGRFTLVTEDVGPNVHFHGEGTWGYSWADRHR